MERVHDDRRPAPPREQCRDASDRPGLRRVRVQDVRPDAADQPGQTEDRDRVTDRRDLAVQLLDPLHLDAELVGHERHRVLAAREAAGDEGRLVAALRQAGGEVGDVERRPAHVQAGDDAQDSDGLVRHERRRPR